MGFPYKGALRLVAAVVIFVACGGVMHAQDGSVGIGTLVPDASALLDMSSTSKGVLVPRMTVVQRDAILLPAHGLLLFNTSTERFEYNAGTAGQPQWRPLLATVDASGVVGDVLTSQGPGLPPQWIGLAELVDGRAWRMGGNANPTSTVLGNLRTAGEVDLSIRAGNATLIHLDGAVGSIGLRGPVLIEGDASPLILDGRAGNDGSVLVSKGAGKTPAWMPPAELPVWQLGGNRETGSDAQLGTLDTVSLRVVTNGQERLRVHGADGSVSIATLADAVTADSVQDVGAVVADASGRLMKSTPAALRRLAGMHGGRYTNTGSETQFNVVITLPAGVQVDAETSITVTPEAATSVSISPFIVRSSRMTDRFTISFPGGLDPGEAVNWMVMAR